MKSKYLILLVFFLVMMIYSMQVNALEVITTSNVEETTDNFYNTYIASFYAENETIERKNTLQIENIENLGLNISNDIIYIYKKPDTKSEKIAILPKNGVCDVLTNKELLEIDKFLQDEEDFILIESGQFKGYVLAKNIATTNIEQYLNVDTYGQLLGDAECKLVPNNNSKTQGVIPMDSIIEVLSYSKDNQWVYTKYNNKNYYIKSSLLNIKSFVNYAYKYEKTSSYMPADTSYNSFEEFQENIVEFALQFVGNKYVWGGTSLTKGADCSGFVQSIYRNFGYSIDRTASSQSNDGKKVAIKDLLPGDLIFYNDGTGISHVAMYIGNGKIIHASNSKPYPKGGIKISNASYQEIYCCRRIYKEK